MKKVAAHDQSDRLPNLATLTLGTPGRDHLAGIELAVKLIAKANIFSSHRSESARFCFCKIVSQNVFGFFCARFPRPKTGSKNKNKTQMYCQVDKNR